MKTQLNLVELAQQIEAQARSARDFVMPASEMIFQHNTSASTALTVPGAEIPEIPTRYTLSLPADAGIAPVTILDHAHRQIATYTGIGSRYYQKMAVEAPDLLADNVNHWLRGSNDNRMLRTLDGKARALLSDSYLRIDNKEVLAALLPVLQSFGSELVFLSAGITDTKLYFKVLAPSVTAEINGQTVYAGFSFTNSEVGLGNAAVYRFLFNGWCTNGCLFGRRDLGAFKRMHRGARLSLTEDYEVYSQETLQLESKASLSKIKDVIRAAIDPVQFNRQIVERLKKAADSPTIQNPIKAVTELRRAIGFTQAEEDAVLTNLIRDNDLSQWGALNAITRVANDHPSYGRASELEDLGSRVLDLNPSQWRVIAEAA